MRVPGREDQRLRDARPDRAMERAMGRLLQAGVMLASAVVLLGGVLSLGARAGQAVTLEHFHGESAVLRRPPQTIAAAFRGDPAAIIQFGVLLLIATPVARVVFAIVAFALERDRLYTAIACGVLLVLLLGLEYFP